MAKKADLKNEAVVVQDNEQFNQDNSVSATEEQLVAVFNDRTGLSDDETVGELSLFVGLDENGNPVKEKFSTTETLKNIFAVSKGSNFLDTFIKNFKESYEYYEKKHLHLMSKKDALQAPIKLADKPFFNRTKVLNTKYPAESIDWDKMKAQGINKEFLLSTGNLEKLLNGEKTDLIKTYPIVGGNPVELSTRLYLSKDENGNYTNLRYLSKLDNVPVNKPFFGYNFSEEEKKALLETGNLGKTISFPNKEGEFFVSVDRQTNQIVATKSDFIKIPKEMLGVKLTSEQQALLSQGGGVLLEDVVSQKTGKTYDAVLQVNAEKRSVDIHFNNSKAFKAVDHRYKQVDGMFKGVKLDDETRKKLYDGKKVFLKDLISDKTGEKYNAWVRFDKRAPQGISPYKLYYHKEEQSKKIEQRRNSQNHISKYHQAQNKSRGQRP